MKTLLLLLGFVFWLRADDDKELICVTHKQLIAYIRKQDKENIERLLVSTPQSTLDKVLKNSTDVESNKTPSKVAFNYYLASLQHLCNPYNHDRISDTIMGSIKCIAAIASIVLDQSNLVNLWFGAGCGTSSLIDFKDAYNNSGAELRTARAHEIYKLIEDLTNK